MSPKLFFSLLFIVNLMNQLIIIKSEGGEQEPVSYTKEVIENLKPSFLNSVSDGIHYLGSDLVKEGTIIAFADLNNDKMTDIITYKMESTTLFKFYANYYIYDDDDNAKFKPELLFEIDNSEISSNSTVRNVHVGAFSEYNRNKYCMIISFDAGVKFEPDGTLIHYLFCEREEKPKILDIHSNILVGNLDEDRTTEILYFDYNNNKRKICKINVDGLKCENSIDFETINDCPAKIEKTIINEDLSLTGGMAFVDIDGDCNSDLVLTHEKDNKRYIEIYKARKSNENKKTYCLTETNIIILDNADEYGAFTLNKINDVKDQEIAPMLDLLIPKPSNNSVLILYNQIRLSYVWTENYFEEKKYSDTVSQIYNINEESKTKLEYLDFTIGSNIKGVELDTSIPTIIRTADFLGKANPGILVNQKITYNDGSAKNFICLYNRDEKLKEFRLFTHFDLAETGDKNTLPLMGVFFDIDESGSFDVIIPTATKNHFFFNYRREVFFVKSKLMNSASEHYDTDLGTTYRYIVTDKRGDRHMDMSTQLIQTSDMNMALPYSLIGLDQTNNYVEFFHTISSSYYNESYRAVDEESRNFKQNSPVIPNTQMMIHKFINKKNQIEWTVDLIVQPMDKIWMFLIIVIFVLLIVLAIIIYLHVKEVQEEQKETTKFKSWFA